MIKENTSTQTRKHTHVHRNAEVDSKLMPRVMPIYSEFVQAFAWLAKKVKWSNQTKNQICLVQYRNSVMEVRNVFEPIKHLCLD